MVGPNMHAGGLLASSQTVSSWVSHLGTGVHWSTGCADPAFAPFVPLRVDHPVGEDAYPTTGVDNRRDDRSLWWRHERLHRRALRDWVRAEGVIAADRDRLERAWIAEPPTTEEALATGDQVRERWWPAVEQVTRRDARPWWLRRRWESFERAAA
jgi:dipeptidase